MTKIFNYSNVLARQQVELKEQLDRLNIVSRDLGVEKLRKIFREGPGIVVIQGIRRCGKSIYAVSAYEDDFVYINFDDERLGGLEASSLELLLEACYEITSKDIKNFIFDEIQLIEGWEPFVSRLGRSKNVIVTGSNAKLLSKELGTSLTGRYLPVVLYPFSFSEYLAHYHKVAVDLQKISAKESGLLRSAFSEYLSQGGFPDVKIYGSEYPQVVYGDILERDIIVRHKIKRPKIFKEFSKVLVSNFGQTLSLSKVGKLVGLSSPNTAVKYAQYLQDTYLCFSLNQYFNKLKAQMVSNKKYYVADSGIINTISYTPTQNLGALLENTVFLELLRQRDYYSSFDEVFFWKSDKSEVDFLLRRKKKPLMAIQVCAELSNPLTRDRELRGLVNIAESLNVEKFLIITSEMEEEIRFENLRIQACPIYKWLINPAQYLA